MFVLSWCRDQCVLIETQQLQGFKYSPLASWVQTVQIVYISFTLFLKESVYHLQLFQTHLYLRFLFWESVQ